MKLSEILAEHPHLDADVEIDNELILDGIYIFRAINPEAPQGSGRVIIATPEGTDGVVTRGLVTSVQQIQAAEWPVHICHHDHDEED